MSSASTLRPRFEESDFDEAEYGPRFGQITGGPNLPAVEFKVEEIADSATPEEMIRAAMEERTIETSLDGDASFGPVVVPAEKSLFGYKYALSSSGHDIRFSHEKYAIFDGVIVRECGADASGTPSHAAFNPRNRHYTFYSPLRRNIAILRNYLMALYPLARDKVNQATLNAMAQRLGGALRGEEQKLTLIQRIVWAIRQLIMKTTSAPSSNRFLALANTPDRGIAFMYAFLREQQADPAFLSALPGAQPPKNWKLAELEQTPFSAKEMAQHSDASRMGLIANAFELLSRNLKSVDDMTPKDKEISVDHARDILKNLRIIFSGVEEEKQYDDMDPRCREAQNMLSAALACQSVLAELARGEPDLLNDPLVLEASKTIVKLGSRVKGEEQSMLKQEQRAETTTTSQQQQPQQQRSRPRERDKQRSRESIQKLVFKFEEGATRLGEIRKARQARARQGTATQQGQGQALSKAPSAAVKQALSKQSVLPKALQEGQSTMASPKIHQVSINDPDFIESVKKINEDKVVEQKKGAPGSQSLGSK